MEEREEKRHATAKKVALAVISVLGVLAGVYVFVQLYFILDKGYRTETAIAYTMSDNVSLDGVVVYDAVNVAGEGDLGYLVADGERVSIGTTIAERYTNSAQGLLRERLDRLDRVITLLNKSQNSTGSDLSLLTTQSRTALYNLLDQIDTASYTGMSAAEEEFLLAQNRLQISTGQADNFDATIAALQTERDSVAAEMGALETITADENGYFISGSAAAAPIADPAAIDTATPSQLQTMLQEGIATSSESLAGRIATGFSWKFYAVCDLETAARFDGLTKVQISVPGKQDEPLGATVLSVETDEESGVAKVVLECQTINAEVLTLGQENAQITLHTYQGIRIDKAAMHIVDGVKGVYVKFGSLQRFRKISILYENDNYILVPADGAVGTDNEVRLYDEIIVEGTNLEDGKLL